MSERHESSDTDSPPEKDYQRAVNDLRESLPDTALAASQWKMLQDYIDAIPDNVKLIENNTKAKFTNSGDGNDCHEVPVDKLHNLIVEAVQSNPSDKCADNFLRDILTKYVAQYLLHVNVKQLECINQYLSFNEKGVKLEVEISKSLISIIKLLVDQICDQQEPTPQQQNKDNKIKIKVVSSQTEYDISVKDVSNLQALLALVVVLKCYPRKWQQDFFWDAWLAVTIQLNQLQKDVEVFPCLWIKQIFYPERLVQSPDRVRCLIMGQDPVSNYGKKYTEDILRGGTGVAFHNTNENSGIPSITKMTDQFGLNCTGDWPIQYCTDGIVLVNMVRCIPRNSGSMTRNLFYKSWFVYSLKLAMCFGNPRKPIVIMCNTYYNNYSKQHQYNELVECIRNYNKTKRIAEILRHPAYVASDNDKNMFDKVVFASNLPVPWRNVLFYISALPNHVELDESKEKAMITRNKFTHEIEVNELHNSVVDVIKCDQLDPLFIAFIEMLLREKIPSLPSNLEHCEISKTDGLQVAFKVSQPLINLLQKVQKSEPYTKNGGGEIKIIDSSDKNSPSYKVTDQQALLALVVTSRCYPLRWRKLFFWDAWLAVTIQLGLLKKVDDNNLDYEVFPCLWMKQVFYAERLIGSPKNVRGLLLGQSPKGAKDDISYLRTATGVDISDDGTYITVSSNLQCGTSHIDQCSNGVFLANMIRCIHRNGYRLDINEYCYAWFCYTLKLVKYCAEEVVPVVLCSTPDKDYNEDDYDEDDYDYNTSHVMDDCIKYVNPKMILLAKRENKKSIKLDTVKVSRIKNNITLQFN